MGDEALEIVGVACRRPTLHLGPQMALARQISSHIVASGSAQARGYVDRGLGRSSNSGVIATVFGSTGFVGRYVVNRLVVLPVRCEEHGWKHMKLMGDLGQIVAVRPNLQDDDALVETMKHSNVVINLIGSDRATRNWSLQAVNVDMPRRIAAAAARANVARFVHMSDVLAGVPDATSHQSEYVRTKALGETAVREHRPDATILRPCDVWGVEDRLLNKLGIMNRRWPVVMNIGPLTRRVQPVWISDLATAVMHAIRHPDTAGRTYELGGPRVYEMQELYRLVQDMTLLPKRVITLPDRVAQPVMNFLGATRKGFFSADHVKSASLDKIVRQEGNVGTIADLGVPEPERLEARAYEILRAYRRPIFVNIVDVESQRHITDQFLPGDRP